MITEPKGKNSDLMPVLENPLSYDKSGLLSEKISVKAESNMHMHMFIYLYINMKK